MFYLRNPSCKTEDDLSSDELPDLDVETRSHNKKKETTNDGKATTVKPEWHYHKVVEHLREIYTILVKLAIYVHHWEKLVNRKICAEYWI